MKCEISLLKMQIQDYPPTPLLISEGIFVHMFDTLMNG